MRDHYDFSTGVRGKYARKVNTADVRLLSSARPAERVGEVKIRNGSSGLDGRHRDLDSELEHKRGDTLVGTLRKTYGPDFAPGVRSDTRLDTLRKGGKSLSKIPKKKRLANSAVDKNVAAGSLRVPNRSTQRNSITPTP